MDALQRRDVEKVDTQKQGRAGESTDNHGRFFPPQGVGRRFSDVMLQKVGIDKRKRAGGMSPSRPTTTIESVQQLHLRLKAQVQKLFISRLHLKAQLKRRFRALVPIAPTSAGTETF